MPTMHIVAAVLLFVAAPAASSAQPRGGESVWLPAPPPAEASSGGVGASVRSAYEATGDFFGGIGNAIGRGCSSVFIRQGEFWKRFGLWFADFQEAPPAGLAQPGMPPSR
jgi:hypothetical protein